MKRIITCLIIAAVIFAGGTAALFYTGSTADKITGELERIEACWQEGDKEGAMEAAREMEQCWESFRKLHMLIADNEHALEITMSMAKITDMLKRDNEEFLTECNVMSELISVYKQGQLPTFTNVL